MKEIPFKLYFEKHESEPKTHQHNMDKRLPFPKAKNLTPSGASIGKYRLFRWN